MHLRDLAFGHRKFKFHLATNNQPVQFSNNSHEVQFFHIFGLQGFRRQVNVGRSMWWASNEEKQKCSMSTLG
ncbi:uncharacterized protein QC764_0114580 [Podospora pseudoanserina]|uniref:Uncharacterized protein n=1 Tax=Podospora pseudoanserina TaxID=2609844 RepID=A0ABR0HJL1_9PEZI|nr:hypothetical protein QC764_0114580 [Podospora pseudoanserina]